MCFSAEASFGSSAVIAVIGTMAIKKAESPAQRVFAMIPVFFAVQQFMEGILWVGLSNSIYMEWTGLATYVFLIFAWIIWPVYIPFSVRMLETEKRQKTIATLFLVIGIVISIILTCMLFFHNVSAEIYGYHIKYIIGYQYKFTGLLGVFYFIPIVISLFISSIKRMWYVGIMILISFIISKLFFEDHLISVWCFFAAITSVTVLWVLYGIRPEVSKREVFEMID